MALMAVDEAALDAFLASDGESTPANEATQEAVDSQVKVEETVGRGEPNLEAETQTEEEDPFLSTQDQFDRKYVEKLRRESASYRERAKRYQSAFDGYEDEQVEAWLGLAKQLKEDPRSTAAELQALAEQINKAYEADLETQEQQHDQAEQEYLSRADVERMFQERERQADLDRRVAQIEIDARDLGYEPGSPDYDELLWFASRTDSGSIVQAHEKIQARNQAIYDRMIAKVAERGAPQVPDGGSVDTDGTRKLKTFDDANEALEAWLATQG